MINNWVNYISKQPPPNSFIAKVYVMAEKIEIKKVSKRGAV